MNSEKERYEERWIGRGAYGDVYELLEHIPPAVIKSMKWTRETDLNDYRRESEILKQLTHPNIVNLIKTREIHELKKFGIIMEYCENGTLKQVIFDPTIIYSMKTVIYWAEQLFDALNYMFLEFNVIHRDIKPENIFVTKDYNLKIGDFGFVKFSEQTVSGTFCGTHRYMSPPQIIERITREESATTPIQTSHRNDIYSLGLVIWEIVERSLPLSVYGIGKDFDRDGLIADVIMKRFTEIDPLDCQETIKKIVERCTNFDRERRPDAKEILEEVKRIQRLPKSTQNGKDHPVFNVQIKNGSKNFQF